MFIVLQSDPKRLAEELGSEEAFPFTIICDPEQKLYREFEMKPAKSKMSLAGPSTMIKLAKVTASGLKHGEYEGEEMQLPAAFILDAKGMITYAHYAKTLDDIPDTDAIVEKFNEI